jgi:hypothetical protein
LNPRVVFYGLLDRRIAEVIEFYPAREPAERKLAEILADQPGWGEILEIVRVEFDGADVRVERA